jgi:hypothetical protein
MGGRSTELKRHGKTDHPESGTHLSPPAFCARLRRYHDAPLIGERAATRWRIATEGGDVQVDKPFLPGP